MGGWMMDGLIVSMVTRLQTELSGIRIPAGARAVGLRLSKLSRPAGPNQPPIQEVPETLSPGVKRPGRDVTPYSAEVKNEWSSSYTSHVCLHVYRDSFTCIDGLLHKLIHK
jgi:hypothetical protein